MAKKKNNNLKSGNSISKIQPISKEVGAYQEALDLYRKHPSLPTFFNLLDQSLSIGARCDLLEKELVHLIDTDDDQYHGAYGSRYFYRNAKDLKTVNRYRHAQADILSICTSLWRFLEKIKTEDIWGYENYLLGIPDYTYLHDKKHFQDTPILKETPNQNIDSGPPRILDETRRILIDALAKQDESERSLSSLAESRGVPMVPWAAWVSDYLPNRPDLEEGIQDLSEYLSSYYVAIEDSEFPASEFTKNPFEIDRDNATALGRISEFLIFNRLFKKIVYKESIFNFELFYRERIEHLSSRDGIGGSENEAQYIIAISNLLMISAKLGLNSVDAGLVSEQELTREFLADVDAECLDIACLSPLPASGFAQMLVAINPHEGDRFDNYRVSKALRVADYGAPSNWDPDIFDEMFDEAFSGIDPEVESFLRQKIEKSAESWLIPLQHTSNISRIFDEFWSDDKIVEKISNALFDADKKGSNGCKFITAELDDVSLQAAYFDEENHPAIFSRKFSNKINFIDFKGGQWIELCRSLVRVGQVRHACTVLALHITIIGINRFYNLEVEKSINVPSMVRLTTQLMNYDSFAIVRQAIADLFEFHDNVPAILKGSLKEFLPNPKGTIVSIKTKAENQLEQHKKNLLEAGCRVSRLSNEARDNLLKGYALARAKDIAVFNLSEDAIRNYVVAVEGELRSRAPDIDAALAEELKYLNVDIDWKSRTNGSGRRGVFRGLVSICNLVGQFAKLSVRAQEKLKGFKQLALHDEFDLFRSSMREFVPIRNSVQHADGSGVDPGSNLERVEELMFGKGGLVRILCETR
jgi:hypothetical protein